MRFPLLTGPLALLLAAALPADQIIKTDGSVIRDVRIKEINIKEVTYRTGSRTETIPTYLVERLRPEDPPRLMEDALDNLSAGEKDAALAGFRSFIERANPRSSYYWMVQLAFWKRAEICFSEGTKEGYVQGLAELDELIKKIPDTFYLLRDYQIRMDYYLRKAKDDPKYIKSALVRNQKWLELIQEKDLSSYYLYDARLDRIMVERRFKKITPEEAQKRLEEIIQRSGGVPRAQNRAKSQLAQILLLRSKLDEALDLFEELVEAKEIEEFHRARAWLGRGKILARQRGADREQHKDSFLCFLRVYGIFEDGGRESARMREIIAEALYHAEKQLPKWAPPETAKKMMRPLYVRRRTIYRTTLFGSRK